MLGLSNSQLLQIFNSLEISDLLAVADTCKAFRRLVDVNFIQRFDQITWRAGDMTARRVFQSFGHLVTSLDVDSVSPHNESLKYIAKICEDRLRYLKLWFYNDGSSNWLTGSTNGNIIMRLKQKFMRLKRIELFCGGTTHWEYIPDLLLSCAELESLSLNSFVSGNADWNRLKIHFPNLKELKFYANKTLTDNGLAILLDSNPGIKKLYLDECTSLTPRAISIIVHYARNLEEITLGQLQNVHPRELQRLSLLKYLKSLVIIMDPAIPLLDMVCMTTIPIEHLGLWYVKATDALASRIMLIKTIKSLEFSGNINDSQVITIARNLPCLVELRLADSNKLTVDGLKNMLLHCIHLSYLELRNITNVPSANKRFLKDFNLTFGRAGLRIEID